VVQVQEIVTRVSKCIGLREPPEELLLWNFNDCSDKYGQIGYTLIDMIREVKPILVVLDPLNAFFAEVEKDATKTTQAYQVLRGVMRDCKCAIVGVHHIRKPSGIEHPGSLESANLNNWFYQARGSRALINGCDVRLGLDRSVANANETVLVMGGFERVRGEIPIVHLDRMLDEDGEPLGYRQITGAQLLSGNPEQAAAYGRLPDTFRFTAAKQTYGKGDQATRDFLNKCKSAGILQQPGRGIYEKIKQQAEQSIREESLPMAA